MLIKIYSTVSCHFCKDAKKYMSENNIPFEEISVSGNPKLISEMREISGQLGVPVITVDGEVMVGWNKDRFDSLYKVHSENIV